MTVSLVIDLTRSVPVFEQIRAQLAGAIATGELQRGERLPTVRGLAADLGIAVNTVARAYSELESAGFVTTRRRLGTVVSGPARPPVPASVQTAAQLLVAAADAAGLDDQTTVHVLQAALRHRPDGDATGRGRRSSGEPVETRRR